MKRKSMGFASGMEIGFARSEAAIAAGESGKTLDWDKAVAIMRERKATDVQVGMCEDWSCTSDEALSGGVPCDGTGCACLASRWATPIIVIDGEEIECWKEGMDNEWWPESALSAWNNTQPA